MAFEYIRNILAGSSVKDKRIKDRKVKNRENMLFIDEDNGSMQLIKDGKAIDLGGGGAVSKVNGKAPDKDGNITIEVPKSVNVMERLPSDLSGISENTLLAVVERSINISWNAQDWTLASLASGTGLDFASTIRIRTNNFLPIEANTKYCALIMTTNDNNISNESMINIFEYKADGTFISSTGFLTNQSVITTNSETSKIKILLRNAKDNVTITTDYVSVAKPVLSKVY